MKLIKLTQGFSTKVDDEDFEVLNKYKWTIRRYKGSGYAVRKDGAGGQNIYMARVIIDAVAGDIVDHINRNPLDNRRINLRTVTRSENGINRAIHKNNTSGYRGVSFDKTSQRWIVHVTKDNKRINVGPFKDKDEAALAYNKAAETHHGEYAVLNVIKPLRKN